MGNATFFTAARMQQIEDSTVVAGLVDVNGHLLLKRRDDQTIDAGNVVGPQGPRGYNNLFDFWQLTNPTSTPPSGSISANTETLVNAATLYFHVMPEGGSSFEGLFRLLKAGSMISVQSAGTPANWAQFTTTSGFSFTGNVASVNVTLKDQAGAAVSSERVAVMFTQPTAITALNLPAGLVMANTLPTGYPEGTIPLEGQAISRTTYAALFAKYGTFYGAGDGSTTFNLPNYKGRTLVGQDLTQTEFDVMGETGGAKTHTLDYKETPVQKGVRLVWGAGNIAFTPAPGAYVGTPPGNSLGTWQNDRRYDADAPNSFSSGGQPHNNLQPYAVVQWVVTTGIGGGLYPSSTGQMGKGTSAQRDGFYGVPTTDAQKVALANSAPIWFNTEKGWEESYYAPSSLSGLTVRGLNSSAPAGWYPVEGSGPKILLSSNGTIQNMATGSVFINWAAPGTAFSWRRGGSDHIEFASGIVKPKIWGRYRCNISLSIQTGSGTAAFTMVHYTDTGVQAYTYSMSTVTLNTSLQDRFDLSVENVELLPNESLRAFASNLGGANLGVLGANLSSASYFLEYIGPALVSE